MAGLRSLHFIHKKEEEDIWYRQGKGVGKLEDLRSHIVSV